MIQSPPRSRLPCRAPLLAAVVLTGLLLSACQTRPVNELPPDAQKVYSQTANLLLPVDCLLPGQVRQLGSEITYLSPRRPIKTTAGKCRIRGGEYVAFDRADYRTALNVWMQDALAGDPKAQTYVGEMYAKGLGIEPNHERAREWYTKAAEQGYSRAQVNLGYLYEKGLGGERDAAKALNLYREASGLEGDSLKYASAVEVEAAQLARKKTKALREESQRYAQEAEAARTLLHQTQDRLQVRRQDLQTAQATVTRLESRLAQHEAAPDNSANEARIQRLRERLERHRAAAAQQQQEIASLESEMAQRQQRLEGKLQVARRQEQSLQQRLATRTKKAEALGWELERLEGLLAASKTDLESKEQQVAGLKDELQQLRNNRSETAARIQELERDLAQQREKVKVLRQTRAAELEQLIEAETEFATLEFRLEQSRQTMSELQAKHETRVKRLKQKLEQRQAELSAQRERIKALEQKAVSHQDELAALEIDPESDSVASPETAVNNAPVLKKELQSIDFGNYYALVIGNGRYSNLPDLNTAVNDAEIIADLLETKYGFETTLLRNADRYRILSELNRLRETLSAQDNLLIYYAGHSEIDQSGTGAPTCYWQSVDAAPNNRVDWIANRAITELLDTIPAQHIMIVADACYSGTLTRASIARPRVAPSDESQVLDETRIDWIGIMTRTPSRTVLSAGIEPAPGPGGEHSVFADAFLDTLRNNEGVLQGYSLYLAIFERMQQMAVASGSAQEPTYAPIAYGGHGAGDFLFVPEGLRS